MRRLILLRHGKAERSSPTGQDVDRGLVVRGRTDARLTGRLLAARGLRPDRALVSAAARTMQTWDELAPAFPDAAVEISRALYHADEDRVLAAAQAADARTVIVVGHNPGLQALAARLAVSDDGARRGLEAGFPTAAAAVFAFTGDGVVEVEGVLVPSDHGGGADA